MVEIPFPAISFTKTQSVDLFCFSTNVHICAKFGDLKPTDEKAKSSNLDLFLSKEQKQH